MAQILSQASGQAFTSQYLQVVLTSITADRPGSVTKSVTEMKKPAGRQVHNLEIDYLTVILFVLSWSNHIALLTRSTLVFLHDKVERFGDMIGSYAHPILSI